MANDVYFMEQALKQAEAALELGEFPVGCVVALENEVLVTGARQGTAGGGDNETDHAEMVALRRLDQADISASREAMTLYCTMEPCLMCFAAVVLSRIGRVVYAYEDAMGGGTSVDLKQLSPLYQESAVHVEGGLLREKSIRLFKRFFLDPRSSYWRDSLLEHYTLSQ